VRKRIDRGLPPTDEDVMAGPVDAAKAQALFGDYVTQVWWPTWKAQHPDSAYCVGKRIEKRILPTFGNLPFAALDSDRVGTWKAQLVAEGLKPTTVNTYLSLLGTILNTAVDSDYLPHSLLMCKSHAGRVAAAKNLAVDRREVWITRGQLDLLAEAITGCYRALVVVAALTGLRWGELAALRWDDMQLDKPLDDGTVSGPGRLRVVRAVSDPNLWVPGIRSPHATCAYSWISPPTRSRRTTLPAGTTTADPPGPSSGACPRPRCGRCRL
jgi:integrase